MAGKNSDAGAMFTVGGGDSSIGGDCADGGDSGHYLKGDPGDGQAFSFLAATAKEEGVSTLEADNDLAGLGMVNQEIVQFVLWNGVQVGSFPSEYNLDILRGEVEQVCVDKGVTNDDIGRGEQFCTAQSEQASVTGACANEIDCS